MRVRQINEVGVVKTVDFFVRVFARDVRNKYNLSEQVLYQEFMTLYKNYFDGSFFETVRQLLPARSKVIDGTLIEPSLLERNKYPLPQVTSNSDITWVGSPTTRTLNIKY